jgi:hypothetical protein
MNNLLLPLILLDSILDFLIEKEYLYFAVNVVNLKKLHYKELKDENH